MGCLAPFPPLGGGGLSEQRGGGPPPPPPPSPPPPTPPPPPGFVKNKNRNKHCQKNSGARLPPPAAVAASLHPIREGHPTTPLLVVSSILCPIHEETPGSSALDVTALSTGQLRFRATGDPAERSSGKLTLVVIRDELARIVEQRTADDPNLHYLDGRELYGEADVAELPLSDQLHPDAATHHRIGERFARLAFAANGPFADHGSPGQHALEEAWAVR